jgi:transcriptional regulator with XRE-family HTH domain
MDQLSKNIQELRKQKGMSQDDLAYQMGVSRQAISKWERGEGLPDLHHVKKLSQTFGVSIDELLNHTIDLGDNKPEERWPLILLLIPMIGISISLVIGLFLIGYYSIDLSVSFFYLIRMRFLAYTIWDMFYIIIPLATLFGIFMVKWFFDLMMKENKDIARFLLTLSFIIIILCGIFMMFTNDISGFALIFSFVLCFLVLICGLIGTLAYHRKHDFIKHWDKIKHFMKKGRYVFILFGIYGLIFSVKFIQDVFLTREVNYVDHLIMVKGDDLHYTLEDPFDNIIGNFTFTLYYEVALEDNPIDPTIHVYQGDMLIYTGFMNYRNDVNMYDIDVSLTVDMKLMTVESFSESTSPYQTLTMKISYQKESQTQIITHVYDDLSISYSPRWINLWKWQIDQYIKE